MIFHLLTTEAGMEVMATEATEAVQEDVAEEDKGGPEERDQGCSLVRRRQSVMQSPRPQRIAATDLHPTPEHGV